MINDLSRTGHPACKTASKSMMVANDTTNIGWCWIHNSFVCIDKKCTQFYKSTPNRSFSNSVVVLTVCFLKKVLYRYTLLSYRRPTIE